MSWTVHIIENTLSIPIENREAFNEEAYYLLESNYNGGGFDSITGTWLPDYDAGEWISQPFYEDNYKAILLKYKVNGFIGFADMEGDNKDKIWGFKFTNGAMEYYRGKIVWELGEEE
jgi:hypothetical protein